MDLTSKDNLIIALEVRRSCFGYAVFEGAACLLDWGATTPHPLVSAIRRAEKRIRFLFKMLPPVTVVVKKPCKPASRSPILGLLKREAARQSVPVAILSGDDVREAFRSYGVKNKYQVAQALTRIFPDLMSKLPQERGTGDSERHAMIVFDAVATGYAHLQAPQLQPPAAE